MALDHYFIAFSSLLGTNILVLDDDNTQRLLGIIQGKAINELTIELLPFSIKSRNYTLYVEKSTKNPINEKYFLQEQRIGPEN